jgi:hypothetical protein
VQEARSPSRRVPSQRTHRNTPTVIDAAISVTDGNGLVYGGASCKVMISAGRQAGGPWRRNGSLEGEPSRHRGGGNYRHHHRSSYAPLIRQPFLEKRAQLTSRDRSKMAAEADRKRTEPGLIVFVAAIARVIAALLLLLLLSSLSFSLSHRAVWLDDAIVRSFLEELIVDKSRRMRFSLGATKEECSTITL